jgi:hypothetical protein
MACLGHPIFRRLAALPLLALVCSFASSLQAARETLTHVRIEAGDAREVAQLLIDAGLDECTHAAPPIPAEVQGLRLHKPAPDSTVTTLTWSVDPMADSYNVYRGTRIDLGDLACFQSGVSIPSTEDDGFLADPGTAVWFLATGANCRGESTLGEGRPNSEPCP